MVVINSDGELLSSTPNSVAGEMLPERTALAIAITFIIYYKANNYLMMFIRFIKIELIFSDHWWIETQYYTLLFMGLLLRGVLICGKIMH